MKAWAKINLTLDVLDKRPDGYHELSSVMQAVCLHDTLLFKKGGRQGIELKSDCPALPTDQRNLVYQAAQCLLLECGVNQGVYIELQKKIPIAAGLAGGSSDCAAALLGLKALLDLDISPKQMFEIGQKLGADVPFCLLINDNSAHFFGTALAEGIGERLTPLPPHPETHLVLARLPILVSTKDIFAGWATTCKCSDTAGGFDNNKCTPQKKTPAMLEAFAAKDISKIAAHLSNDLAPIATALHPEIAALIAAFWTQNPLGVNMTGSGPTVFAYFSTESDAIAAMKYIQQHFFNCDIFYTKPK